jgi:hypothetical protein
MSSDKIVISVVVVFTLGVIGLAVWQQQKRLPELEARRPKVSEQVTPPPGLFDKDGKAKSQSNPLEFASLFENLKPAKQECFREKYGEARLNEMLKNPSFVPGAEDNRIIGECLFAGTTMEESPPSAAPGAPSGASPAP